MSNVLYTNNLSKYYGKHCVLDNINLIVPTGCIYGLIGENGAGKTTLLKILTGLTHKTSGEYRLFEAGTKTELSKILLQTGTIIENPALYINMTALQNLSVISTALGFPQDNTRDILKFVGLSDVNKKVKHFSLGMKQRLGLGIALLGNPKLLILDEPLNGLDPTGIIEFRNLLITLNSLHSVTIIISSHILSELEQIATDYGFMHKGTLIEQISAEKLKLKCQKSTVITTSNNNLALKVLSAFSSNIVLTAENKIEIFGEIKSIEDVSKILSEHNIFITGMYQKVDGLEQYYENLIGGT